MALPDLPEESIWPLQEDPSLPFLSFATDLIKLKIDVYNAVLYMHFWCAGELGRL